MNRSLAGIVAIGIIALGCMGIAAWMLADRSPKLAIQKAMLKEVPTVRVRTYQLRTDPQSKRTTIELGLVPMGATVTADEVARAAHVAAIVLRSDDLVPTSYDEMEVLGLDRGGAPAGGPRGRWTRREAEGGVRK